MPSKTIKDPLSIALQISKLRTELADVGVEFQFGTSPQSFKQCKFEARGSNVTPYFDNQICDLSTDRFFWAQLVDSSKGCVSLQAFRCDTISESLAEWAPIFTIGLYMRSGEVLVPAGNFPASGSIAERISGKVVYHGELWVSGQWRSRNIFNNFTRIGVLLATLKWNPDAIWALASKQMATHGHPTRMGYSHVESGFLRWMWTNEEIPGEEWLMLSDRNSLEQIVASANETNLQQQGNLKPA